MRDYLLFLPQHYRHFYIRTKVGYKSGGNVEEEIKGNHAYNISGYVRGNIGPLEGSAASGEGDVDINIVGSMTTVIGKKATIFSEDDMKLITNNDLFVSASDNMTITTTSGIMSFKSGSDLDMRSQTAMVIKTETTMSHISGTTFATTSGTSWTATIGTTWGVTAGDDITIVGGPNINLNP